MVPVQLIKKGNLDALGKHFMKVGFEFFFLNEIGKSYEFIRLGLSILTCDCERGSWKMDTSNISFGLPTSYNFVSLEYHFCKAVILSYHEDKKSLYVALDSIENYLTEGEDGLGFYVKGRILTVLEQYDTAKDSYDISLNLEHSSRTTYRLGRLKEQFLQTFGLDDLFKAYTENPSSGCCCRVLKEHSMKREILPLLNANTEGNILIAGFVSSDDPWQLQRDLESQMSLDELSSHRQFTNAQRIMNEFVEFVSINKDVFIPVNVEEDYDDYDDYGDSSDYYDNEPDYDEMYFDAMTDGQLGSYDEFTERGGNSDWIDDWAGR
ncbi:MAG: hypothetical protein EOO06_03295 [Chitinophagaceae bacterium]|nr:MAG: hypothetical protein EOO06_03295 [Chitinophagaceae bacterium]